MIGDIIIAVVASVYIAICLFGVAFVFEGCFDLAENLKEWRVERRNLAALRKALAR